VSGKLAPVVPIAPRLSKRKRARRSKQHDAARSPAVMAIATRGLYCELDGLVAMLDAANARGLTDADAFANVQFYEWSPTRHGLSPLSGVQLAIAVYAERTTVDSGRKLLGLQLGMLARKVVEGHLSPEKTAWAARRRRRDGWPGDHDAAVYALRDALQRRSHPERWSAAYRVLAFDADCFPRPSAHRGLRGALREHYETLCAPSPLVRLVD
jgi:hypothetical protein